MGARRRAVEPIVGAVDRRLDDDMVEGAERRQPVLQQIAEHRTDQRRPRRDAEPVEHGEQQQRLGLRSEEHTSELQSLMRISYAVFCLKKKNKSNQLNNNLPQPPTLQHQAYMS